MAFSTSLPHSMETSHKKRLVGLGPALGIPGAKSNPTPPSDSAHGTQPVIQPVDPGEGDDGTIGTPPISGGTGGQGGGGGNGTGAAGGNTGALTPGKPGDVQPITPIGPPDGSAGSHPGSGGNNGDTPPKPQPVPEAPEKPQPKPTPTPAPEPPKNQTQPAPAPVQPQPQPQPEPPSQPPVQNVTQPTTPPVVQNATQAEHPSYQSNATVNVNATAPAPIPTANSTLLTPLPTLTKPSNVTLNTTQPVNGTMLGNATSVGINAASAPKHSSSGLNVGELIGIIAGSLAGLIIICSIISIPLRRQRRRHRKVDWLDFSASHDQPDDDEPISSAEAVMRNHRVSILTRHRTRKPSRGGGMAYGDHKDTTLFNPEYRNSYGGESALTPNVAGIGGGHHGADGHGHVDVGAASAMYTEPGYEMAPVMMHPGGGHMGMGTPYGMGMSQGDGTGPAYYYANLDATNATFGNGPDAPHSAGWQYPTDDGYSKAMLQMQPQPQQQWSLPLMQQQDQERTQYDQAQQQQQQPVFVISPISGPLNGGPAARAAEQDDAIAYAEYFGTMGTPDDEPASPAQAQVQQIPTRSASATTGTTVTAVEHQHQHQHQHPSPHLLASRRNSGRKKPYPKATSTSASASSSSHSREDSIVPTTPIGKIGVITVANASPGELPYTYPDNRF